MAKPSRIRLHSFAPAPLIDQQQGLLGFASIQISRHVMVYGMGVRRMRNGEFAVVFPDRRDSNGKRHPVVRPLNEGLRLAVERQVLAQLRQRGQLPA